jgi:acyl carrier protein
MLNSIKDVLKTNQVLASKMDALKPSDDLYEAGLVSFDTVALMLALEDKFDVEFSDTMLNRRTFSSMSEIESALTQLVKQKSAS